MTNMKAVLLTDESRALPNGPNGLKSEYHAHHALRAWPRSVSHKMAAF